jgi:hypothetical protein
MSSWDTRRGTGLREPRPAPDAREKRPERREKGLGLLVGDHVGRAVDHDVLGGRDRVRD